jgi:hypothetical protein
MNKSNKTMMLYRTTMLCVLSAFAVPAYSRGSSKHVIGETVAQFATKVGVDLSACHKRKLHTWTCVALISAERGRHVVFEKEGEWLAVLEDGKLLSYIDFSINRPGELHAHIIGAVLSGL